MPSLLLQAALIIIVARSGYRTFQLAGAVRKQWLDILFHASVAILALSFLL